MTILYQYEKADKCCTCSSKEKLERHYAKALRKNGVPIKDI
jgi:hypothetical protein